MGREILRVLDRHFALLVRTLDHEPEARIPVILLSRESYAAATGAPGWSGGLYDSFDGRVRIPIARPHARPDPGHRRHPSPRADPRLRHRPLTGSRASGDPGGPRPAHGRQAGRRPPRRAAARTPSPRAASGAWVGSTWPRCPSWSTSRRSAARADSTTCSAAMAETGQRRRGLPAGLRQGRRRAPEGLERPVRPPARTALTGRAWPAPTPSGLRGRRADGPGAPVPLEASRPPHHRVHASGPSRRSRDVLLPTLKERLRRRPASRGARRDELGSPAAIPASHRAAATAAPRPPRRSTRPFSRACCPGPDPPLGHRLDLLRSPLPPLGGLGDEGP